jgi:outer membrane lipoprotein-sorting protein
MYAVILAVATLALTAFGQTAPAGAKTAEEVFKNIQSLKGVPADQVLPAMQFISVSLGVECTFCHVQGKMDLDEKKPKQTAREMIAMTNAINKDSFGGHREITCYSCHHGSEHPGSTPAVLTADTPEHSEKPAASPAGQPVTAEQILDKYIAALGGEDAIKKVTSRVETGVILAGGQETPIDVYAKAPNKRVSIMHASSGDSVTAFDGTAGWLGNSGRPARDMSAAESGASQLDSDLYLALDLKTTFKQLRTGRPEKVNDVECLTLIGMRPDLPPVRFYFDEKSGLLVREVRYTENPLGRMPTQIDYSDYKTVDGVQVPLRWTLARPNGRFTIQIKDVKQNVPVDDAKFVKAVAGTK